MLERVFECLSSEKAAQKVCECVMEMAVNLLTLGAEEGVSEEEGGVAVGGAPLRVKGEELVGPYVPRVLGYLSRVIGGRGGRAVRGKERDLEKEFVVLSR